MSKFARELVKQLFSLDVLSRQRFFQPAWAAVMYSLWIAAIVATALGFIGYGSETMSYDDNFRVAFGLALAAISLGKIFPVASITHSVLMLYLSLISRIVLRTHMSNHRKPGQKPVKPVGHRAHKLLSFLFFEKTYKKNFYPAIADMRMEADQADANGKIWKRRWIVFIGHTILIPAILLYFKVWIGKKIIALWKLS